MERDEWEEQLLKQMVEMFRQLGIDVDEDDLSQMMNQCISLNLVLFMFIKVIKRLIP